MGWIQKEKKMPKNLVTLPRYSYGMSNHNGHVCGGGEGKVDPSSPRLTASLQQVTSWPHARPKQEHI